MQSDILSDQATSGHIISANDLLIGDVVYATATGNWTRNIDEASVLFAEEDMQTALVRAEDQVSSVIGAYLVRVSLNAAGNPVPIHYREKIRDNGPSVASPSTLSG